MQEKIISAAFDRATVEVGGEVVRVKLEGNYRWVFIRHISGEILCGTFPGISVGADGVSRLTEGGCRLEPSGSAVYIGGEGACEVIGSNLAEFPFKAGARGGEGGDDGYIVQSGTATPSTYGEVAVTFPVAFAEIPVVVASCDSSQYNAICAMQHSVTGTGVKFLVMSVTGSSSSVINKVPVHWIAHGKKA